MRFKSVSVLRDLGASSLEHLAAALGSHSYGSRALLALALLY